MSTTESQAQPQQQQDDFGFVASTLLERFFEVSSVIVDHAAHQVSRRAIGAAAQACMLAQQQSRYQRHLRNSQALHQRGARIILAQSPARTELGCSATPAPTALYGQCSLTGC